MNEAPSDKINRFLRTRQYDLLFWDWPGSNTLDRIVRGSNVLRDALIKEVQSRERAVTVHRPVTPMSDELASFTRAKIEPMIRGFFSRKESEPVLALLEKSVVFLTQDHIETRIRQADLDTAWKIADIYLRSIGADPLDGDGQHIVGMSVETTCYVSIDYFSEEDPFADYVVHEVAHVFHNCKRRTAGLQETRKRQWLLPIAFRKRETFAYACEAYSRIAERAKTRTDKQILLEELKTFPPPPNAHVDPNEYFDILTEALGRRNGWKSILARCSNDA